MEELTNRILEELETLCIEAENERMSLDDDDKQVVAAYREGVYMAMLTAKSTVLSVILEEYLRRIEENQRSTAIEKA